MLVHDVTLSVYTHRAGLKNMPGHGGSHRGQAYFSSLPGVDIHSHRGQAYFSSLPGVDIHSE